MCVSQSIKLFCNTQVDSFYNWLFSHQAMPELQHLDLKHNCLKKAPLKVFSNSKLTVLDLSHNQVMFNLFICYNSKVVLPISELIEQQIIHDDTQLPFEGEGIL